MKRRTLIEGYPIRTGDHCGSVAMRNLLLHYCKLDLPEEAAFGLGSGIDLLHWEMKEPNAPLSVFGRNITMEADCARALGIDYREKFQPDNRLAWEEVRAEVEAGRPTMLSGDIFYLDYRKFKVHFPLHRFVLLGYDEEAQTAAIADRITENVETCSLQAVAKSRNAPVGFSTVNLWGKFHDVQVANPIEEACRIAIAKSAKRMLDPENDQIAFIRMAVGPRAHRYASGVGGIAALGESVKRWAESENGPQRAAEANKTFQSYGTGGANFRNLYARFLRWVAETAPDLIDREILDLSDRGRARWEELSKALEERSTRGFDPASTRRLCGTLEEIEKIETDLFARLGERSGG